MAQYQRELDRQARALECEMKAQERQEKLDYAASRAAGVDAMNAHLDAEVEALEGLLRATLQVDDHFWMR
jgi:hypothetical protein